MKNFSHTSLALVLATVIFGLENYLAGFLFWVKNVKLAYSKIYTKL